MEKQWQIQEDTELDLHKTKKLDSIVLLHIKNDHILLPVHVHRQQIISYFVLLCVDGINIFKLHIRLIFMSLKLLTINKNHVKEKTTL